MASWEGSKKDKQIDRRNARRAKMSMRDYEGSPADMAEDRKHEQGYSKGGAVRGGGAAVRGLKCKVC